MCAGIVSGKKKDGEDSGKRLRGEVIRSRECVEKKCVEEGLFGEIFLWRRALRKLRHVFLWSPTYGIWTYLTCHHMSKFFKEQICR